MNFVVLCIAAIIPINTGMTAVPSPNGKLEQSRVVSWSEHLISNGECTNLYVGEHRITFTCPLIKYSLPAAQCTVTRDSK
jgi:hypothetical protein